MSAVNEGLRTIKQRHGVARHAELKWTRLSPGKQDLYLEVVHYFFQSTALRARVLIAPKANLRHEAFLQDHDTWYYKMYYSLLHPLLATADESTVYLDVKDTRSADKARFLESVLRNKLRDFKRERVKHVQNVRSHEVEIMQVADLLAGALSYRVRGLSSSAAKVAVVHELERLSSHSLDRSTPLTEGKLNLFFWRPQ